MIYHRLRSWAAVAAMPVLCLVAAGRANAAPLSIVTPGEQNTQSGENGCAATPCAAGHWLHYPELLQVALGSGYTVHNNGDGGAVLGCDAATMAVAGGASFCASSQYASSIATPPDIVIIGPFGEHDQRIVAANATNVANLYKQSVFEGAYEGLVQRYLKFTTKIYMMTPIDVPWGGTPTLPAGDDLVKNIMLPASLKIAANHQLTVIDTYTAISGTPALVTMYYAVDGQVNSAGQQKMAALILAALMNGGTGDAGVADGASDTGAGGAGGAGGGNAGGGSGAGGTVGMAGASGTGGSGVGTGGSSNSGGTAGSAGAVETAGNSGVGTGGSAADNGSDTPQDSGGCSCSVLGGQPVTSRASIAAAMMALFAGAFMRRKRTPAGKRATRCAI
jgi:hypothetical protein